MADNHSSVAIIIVTYNSSEEIGPCLESLVGHTDPFQATITVVDNQSSDGTADLVRARFPSVQVIESGGNLGFSRANNLGIRATQSDYVLVLNPDTITPPGGLQTLVRGLAVHQDAAIAGPRLLGDRGFPELSWGPPISPWGEFKQKILLALYHRRVRRVVKWVDRMSRQARPVAWVSGACMAIRRADLEAVGHFDERYFMYTEDVDLCMAMGRARAPRPLHGAGRDPAPPRTVRRPQPRHRAACGGRATWRTTEKHHPRWAGLLALYLKATGRFPAD